MNPTVAQAAVYLGVSVQRVLKLAARGTLIKEPIDGRTFLITQESLDAYATSKRKPGNPAWTKGVSGNAGRHRTKKPPTDTTS